MKDENVEAVAKSRQDEIHDNDLFTTSLVPIFLSASVLSQAVEYPTDYWNENKIHGYGSIANREERSVRLPVPRLALT